jgi:hypothetical protein
MFLIKHYAMVIHVYGEMEVESYNFQHSHWMEVSGQVNAAAAFPSAIWASEPIASEVGWSPGADLDVVEYRKSAATAGIEPRAVQIVARPYTDLAILAPAMLISMVGKNYKEARWGII